MLKKFWNLSISVTPRMVNICEEKQSVFIRYKQWHHNIIIMILILQLSVCL